MKNPKKVRGLIARFIFVALLALFGGAAAAQTPKFKTLTPAQYDALGKIRFALTAIWCPGMNIIPINDVMGGADEIIMRYFGISYYGDIAGAVDGAAAIKAYDAMWKEFVPEAVICERLRVLHQTDPDYRLLISLED